MLSGAATFVVGDAVGISKADENGAIDLWDASTEEDSRPIGTSMGVVSVDTEYGWVMLAIRD